MLDDVKAAWTAFWETPEAKTKSEQAKRNRNSEPGGPGTGKKIHFGGSRNSEQIAGDLVELGNIPVGFVSFRLAKKLHFKNGVYTSRKAQNIIEEVERLIEEARRPIPGTTEPRQVTAEMENAFYGKVVKLDAKGRLFGQGCMSHGIRDSSSSSGSSRSQVPVSDPRYSELESRLDHFEQTLIPRLDLMQKTLEKYVHIGRILESLSSHTAPPPP